MENAVNTIYEEILNRILTMELQPGERISENKVGESYNVSRTIVRSAFKILQEQGYLNVIPKSGTYVSRINSEYIEAAVLIRIGMEKEIIERVIRNSEKKEKLISTLKECCNMQKRFLEVEKNPRLFDKYDILFHEAIIASYTKYNMKEMINTPILHFKRWRNLVLKGGYSLDRILKEHNELINAIECEDMERISQVINNHLDKTIYSKIQIREKYENYFE